MIEKCQQFANAERVAAWAEASAVLMRSVAHGPGLTGAPLDVRLQEAINTMMLALLWTYPNARTTPNGLAALIAIPPDLRNELAPMVRDLVDYGLPRIPLTDETIIQICQAVMNTRKAGGAAAPDGGTPTPPLDEWSKDLDRDQDGHVYRLRFNAKHPIDPSIIQWVRHLPHVKAMSITDAGATIPAEISQLTTLTQLEITGATAIPAELSALANLEWLHIADSTINAAVLPALAHLSNLTGLVIEHCKIAGGLASVIGHLTQLEELWIENTTFADPTLPDIFGEMAALSELRLIDCQFTGPFPASLIGLHQLKVVNLSRNRLHGTIPDTIRTRQEKLTMHLRDSGITVRQRKLPKRIRVYA